MFIVRRHNSNNELQKKTKNTIPDHGSSMKRNSDKVRPNVGLVNSKP